MPFDVQYGSASPQLFQGAADAAVANIIQQQNQTTLDFAKLASGANIDWAGLQQRGDIAFQDRQQRNDLAGFNSGVDLLKQFNQNQFAGNQSQLDRIFRGNESANQRAFQGQESAADRAAKFDLQNNAQGFQSGESALDRALRESLQQSSQDYGASQSGLERAARFDLQSNAQDYGASESGLHRAAQFDLQDQSQGFHADQAAQNRSLQAAEHGLTPVMGYSTQSLLQRQALDFSDQDIKQRLLNDEYDQSTAQEMLNTNEQSRQAIAQTVTGYQQRQPQIPDNVQQWVANPANGATEIAPGIYRNANGDTFQWDQHAGKMTVLSQREQFGPAQIATMTDAYLARRPNASPEEARQYALEAAQLYEQQRQERALPPEVQQQLRSVDSQVAPARSDLSKLNGYLNDLTTAKTPKDTEDALHAIPGFERVANTPDNVASARNYVQTQIGNAQRILGQVAAQRQDIIASARPTGGGAGQGGGPPTSGPSWDPNAPEQQGPASNPFYPGGGPGSQGGPQAPPQGPSAMGPAAQPVAQAIDYLETQMEKAMADASAAGNRDTVWGIPRQAAEKFLHDGIPRLQELMDQYGADPRRYPNGTLAAEFVRLKDQLDAVNAARVRTVERVRAAGGQVPAPVPAARPAQTRVPGAARPGEGWSPPVL